MSKIVLQGYIQVPETDLEQVESELGNHLELTRQEPGCIIFRVEKDEHSAGRFNVYEEFIDRNAFDLHQQRVKSSRWREVTMNVSRHYQVSEHG